MWAALGAALGFIPYVGPVLGAGAPLVISQAALEGWKGPLMVVALFVGRELFTDLVLETVLYAGGVDGLIEPQLASLRQQHCHDARDRFRLE